ncbi:MAG: phosphate signaling complex protein PhoU [Pseudonocardia sp.]|nr:phosphate signaling complex protein PhoU [Pseudonocardia sp.]
MRDSLEALLDQLDDTLTLLGHEVATAMQRATAALVDSRLRLAEQVISGDSGIDELRAQADEFATQALALQQPVATDLRAVVAAIHVASDFERMGGLAAHVAMSARRRYPDHVVPESVRPLFRSMGEVAVDLARKAADVVRTRDVQLAAAIDREDDEMDRLHRELFAVLMAPAFGDDVQAAVDLTLLGRFYERYADHAVAVSRRVVYVVTGTRPGPLNV